MNWAITDSMIFHVALLSAAQWPICMQETVKFPLALPISPQFGTVHKEQAPQFANFRSYKIDNECHNNILLAHNC